MLYRVEIAGEERLVEVDGDTIRVDGVEIQVGPGTLDGEIEVFVDGRPLRLVPLPARADGRVAALFDGRVIEARVESERDRLRARLRPPARASRQESIRSDIPGVIRQILKSVGDTVRAGEAVLTLEAMKMENELRATADGTLDDLRVTVGQVVRAGEVLAVVAPA